MMIVYGWMSSELTQCFLCWCGLFFLSILFPAAAESFERFQRIGSSAKRTKEKKKSSTKRYQLELSDSIPFFSTLNLNLSPRDSSEKGICSILFDLGRRRGEKNLIFMEQSRRGEWESRKVGSSTVLFTNRKLFAFKTNFIRIPKVFPSLRRSKLDEKYEKAQFHLFYHFVCSEKLFSLSFASREQSGRYRRRFEEWIRISLPISISPRHTRKQTPHSPSTRHTYRVWSDIISAGKLSPWWCEANVHNSTQFSPAFIPINFLPAAEISSSRTVNARAATTTKKIWKWCDIQRWMSVWVGMRNTKMIFPSDSWIHQFFSFILSLFCE